MTKGKIVYCIDGMPNGFSPNANIWQKLNLFGKSDGCAVVDFSKNEKIPSDAALCCYETMSLMRLARACLCRLLHPTRRLVLLLWDPPGMFRLDSKRIRDVVQCKLMQLMMEFAGRGAERIIWNLHPGFAQSHYSAKVIQKSRFFPNGTLARRNQSLTRGVRHIPKRIAVNAAFRENKGCWTIADLFIRLWERDHETSIVWVGYSGLEKEVKTRILDAGVAPSQVVIPGYVPYEESLKLLASADIAFNFYHDLESLRWNYVLKAPEFMSLGLPIVSPALPGSIEYVRDGETGFVFAPGIVDAAFLKLVELLDDRKRLEQMRERCLAAAQRYEWSTINAAILAELKSIG